MRVEPGTSLQITAGIGAFSKKANSNISIDGKSYSIAADGAVHYIFKAPMAPGRYKRRVRIEFIDQEGKPTVLDKDVIYSVVQ